MGAAQEVLAGTSRRGSDGSMEPWAPLTAREFEVARLITEGMTNAQVAAKLGVGRRAEVAAWVASIGTARVRLAP